MLNAFTLSNGRLSQIHLEQNDLRSGHPIWIDLVAPSAEERQWVEQTFGLTLPRPEHLRDIEASARFYEENGELHLRSDFLLGKESHSRSVTVAFVLYNGILFSVHEEDLPVFQQLRLHTHAQAGDVENCNDVLVDLYSMDVEFSADALEEVYADLGHVSRRVLNTKLSDKDAAAVLTSIAQAEHLNSRVHIFLTPSPYFATILSEVSSSNPSTRACATRLRSNGSASSAGNSFTATVCSLVMASSR